MGILISTSIILATQRRRHESNGALLPIPFSPLSGDHEAAHVYNYRVDCNVPRARADSCKTQLDDLVAKGEVVTYSKFSDTGVRFENIPKQCVDYIIEVEKTCAGDHDIYRGCGERCVEWPSLSPEEMEKITKSLGIAL